MPPLSELVKLLWTIGSVIFGFQITAFVFRFQRETKLCWRERHFPVCEYLNLLSMGFFSSVFVLPLVHQVSDSIIKGLFVEAVVLLGSYPWTVAAHYRILFRPRAAESSSSVCSVLEGVLFVLAIGVAARLGFLASRS